MTFFYFSFMYFLSTVRHSSLHWLHDSGVYADEHQLSASLLVGSEVVPVIFFRNNRFIPERTESRYFRNRVFYSYAPFTR